MLWNSLAEVDFILIHWGWLLLLPPLLLLLLLLRSLFFHISRFAIRMKARARTDFSIVKPIYWIIWNVRAGFLRVAYVRFNFSVKLKLWHKSFMPTRHMQHNVIALFVLTFGTELVQRSTFAFFSTRTINFLYFIWNCIQVIRTHTIIKPSSVSFRMDSFFHVTIFPYTKCH